MRLLAIFGTRPELIKLAPVVRAIRASSEFSLGICATAQHRDLVDPLLRLFNITPDIDLDVMQPDQTPTDVIREVLAGLGSVLARERPDAVIVQGDTATTAAAAVAARYAAIPLVHIEAGLRTGRLDQPFPEEVNRRIVGAIADLHCAPTARARENLLSEGVDDSRIVVTGNTGIDALQWALAMVGQTFRSAEDGRPEGLPCDPGILVTVHRRESVGAPLEQICFAVRDLAELYGPAAPIVWPVHPNPQVMNTVRQIVGGIDSISLVPAVDYLTLVHLLKQTRLVLTDSGGLQEEAPTLGKPVLVLREITERPEGVEAGTARLVGSDRRLIVDETSRLIEDDEAYARMARKLDVYGDGRASARIVEAIRQMPARKPKGKSQRQPLPSNVSWLVVFMLALGLTGVACRQESPAPPPTQSQTPPAAPAQNSTPAPAPAAPAAGAPVSSSNETRNAKPQSADVESKIDSQLLVEIHRREGISTPPGSTGVRVEGDRAFVDVRAEVTLDLVALIARAGDIVSSSARDRSVLAWIPIANLKGIAADPTVRAVMPAAVAITQQSPKPGDEINLHVGGAITIPDNHLTLTVEKISDDSRCPENAKCVWAGDATVHVVAMIGDGTRASLELHTGLQNRDAAQFRSFRVRLVRLVPPRPDQNALSQDRYVVTLAVSGTRVP